MAYDSARGRTVLFGGTDGQSQTWEWDGHTWAQRFPSNVPPSRAGHAMAYDRARGVTVMFGGTQTNPLGDTWEWNGTTWTNPPVVGPTPRANLAMAYDIARGKTVLFGGTDGQSETWEWDGVAWVQRFPLNPPPFRAGHAMAYDSSRHVTVLFGGTQSGPLGDTWEWNGSAWTQQASTGPTPRAFHAMAFDEARGRIVLFGGSDGQNQTWEWDGVAWTQRFSQWVPPFRRAHALAYDSARGRTVMFGGFDGASLGDTLEWAAPCEMVAVGHPGGGLPLGCTSAPVIGSTSCLAFPNASAQGLMAIGVAPVIHPPLATTTPLTCAPGNAYVNPFIVLPVTGDPGVVCFSIPPIATLAGQSFCIQGGSINAGGCVQLTNAVVITIQP